MGLDMYLYLVKYESCSKYEKNLEERRKGFYPEEMQDQVGKGAYTGEKLIKFIATL